MSIEIKYNPQEDEKKEQERWFNCDIYHWDAGLEPNLDFVIDTPPPTVSGYLHMGHVFSYCQTDFVARYQRMSGKNVFYPIGFDDNGLPTERLVEKTHNVKGVWMNKQGKKQEFIDLCYGVVNDAEKEFEKLFKTLGISYDWRQKYQTISKSTNDLAVETYNKLKNAGLIEQRNGAVYWDVVDQTALAQSIIEDKEIDGAEHYLKCYVVNEDGTEEDKGFVIMTTRPELLPACVAVFYNPNDERYNGSKGFSLEGKTASLPFTQQIPFLADNDVKMDKGTGLVMCCTYGDWQDVEWVRKHNLHSRVIVDKEGRFFGKSVKSIQQSEQEANNGNWSGTIIFEYQQNENGKYPKAIVARKQILEKIKEKMPERIVEVKPIKHVVKVGERSKEPIEIIESTQIYVKSLQFKDDMRVLCKYVNFHPEHLKNRLIQWNEGLNQDWCISRDRFFGIEIPDNGELQQVFDTWFTSASSPFVCREAERLERSNGKYDDRLKNTTSLRPQAHEIIRTWTFCTMLKTYLLALIDNNLLEARNQNKNRIIDWLQNDLGKQFIEEKLLPWKDVMLSGWCLAKDGNKMSKSAGNVITPTSLIEEKGSDIVRYWAGSCSLGVDTAFNETKFLDGKKLVNKLINATKLAVMNFEKQNLQSKTIAECIENVDKTADKWIISRLVEVIKQYRKSFDEFEYSVAKNVVERFFWDEYCDNYLEIVKSRAYQEDISALSTLRVMTEAFLLLFAPYISHITSSIYREIFNKEVHARGSFNELFAVDYCDLKAIDDMKIGFEIINFVRQKKADLKISIKVPIKKLVVKTLPATILDDIKTMLSIEKIESGEEIGMEI